MTTEIPAGSVKVRWLHREYGDLEEILPIEKALIKITDTELIIDEKTNTLVQHGELKGKLEKGEVKELRVQPPVRGG